MKKLLALTLSVAMVLSLASVAFAADKKTSIYVDEDQIFTADNGRFDEQVGNQKLLDVDNDYYFPIFTGTKDAPVAIDKYDIDKDKKCAKGMKAKVQWTQNGSMIDSVSIVKVGENDEIAVLDANGNMIKVSDEVKKKIEAGSYEDSYITVSEPKLDADGKVEEDEDGDTVEEDVYYQAVSLPSMYAVKVTVKPTNAGGEINIVGKLDVSKSGLEKEELDLFLPVKLGQISDVPNADGEDNEHFYDELYRYKYSKNEDEEFEIELYGDVGTFTVNTEGQGKLVIKQDVEYNEGLEEIFPDMNYVYINGNGARFNKIGTMILDAVETDVIYQIVDGKPVKVNAVYDDAEEGYVFKTRTIGQYVVAEKELDLDAIPAEGEEDATTEVEAPAVEETVNNPETGAAC